MRLLFTSLLLLSIASTPVDCIMIDKKIYKVCYSQDLQNPVSADYVVYQYRKGVDRKGVDFYGEKDITTADNVDFADNVYDKGHLAPAESFGSTRENLLTTFSYVNCSLQHYKLNRGVWASLEQKERDWSQQDSVVVHVDILFSAVPKRVKGGAAIPDWFMKTITLKKANVKYTYRFPNKDTSGKGLENYLVK